MFELCKPSNRKYATAITTVLGRHLDAVVVDTDETAMACIQAMREQRSGTATFLPLNSIQPTPVNDRLRHFRGARLAIDIVAFDAQLERAMHYVCGSALVCDDLAAAREICFDKGQEVKAVTLDGTVIHRSGQMTGGNTGESGSRKWDEHEVVGLRRLEESLRAQLVELRKNRPRETTDERYMAEVTRLEAELQIAKDDLSATKLRLKSVKDELKHVRKSVKELGDQAEKVRTTRLDRRLTCAQLRTELEEMDGQMAELRTTIDAGESTIFTAFCKRLKLPSIRHYEDKQLKIAEGESTAQLKFTKQIARLNTQISFEEGQLKTFDGRLATLSSKVEAERATSAELESRKTETEAALDTLEGEIETLRTAHAELEVTLEQRTTELEAVKKSASDASRAYTRAVKEIGAWNDEIVRAGAERASVYRKCKLEEIELPLTSGNLNDVPIEDDLRAAIGMDAPPDEDAMDLDQDDSADAADKALKPADLNAYGLEVDFDELTEEEQAVRRAHLG